MASFTKEEILRATGGRVLKEGESQRVQSISTDSRTVGPGALFVPILGQCYDGHRFIGEALGKGAAGSLTMQGRLAGFRPEDFPQKFFISVEDTTRALGSLASYHRSRFGIPLVAIAGSNGKTTTKEMLASILGSRGPVLKSSGNLNNLIGLPLSLFCLQPQHWAAVLELGMSLAGEMRRLGEIARPTLAVITNISLVHLESLGTLEAVREAKGELLESLGEGSKLIFNADDPHCRVLADRFRDGGGEAVSFGFGAGAHVSAEALEKLGLKGIRFVLRVGSEKGEVCLPLVGSHNASNGMAAAAAAHALGFSLEEIVPGLESSEAPAMRMEVEKLPNGVYLINDAYNANPKSVLSALEALSDLKGKGRAFLVLGDMLELGAFAEEAHRTVGHAAANSQKVNYFFTLGDLSAHALRAAGEGGLAGAHLRRCKSHTELAKLILSLAEPGDLVLIKGSRAMRMERVVEELRR